MFSDGPHKQTDKQTDGHGDSMTESARRANSVKTNVGNVGRGMFGDFCESRFKTKTMICGYYIFLTPY